MDELDQKKLNEASWHLKDELADSVDRDVPIEWCLEVLLEVLVMLGHEVGEEGKSETCETQ